MAQAPAIGSKVSTLGWIGVAAVVSLSILIQIVYERKHSAHPKAADQIVAVVNQTVLHQSDLGVLSPSSHDEAVGLLVDFTLLDQEAQKKHIEVTPAEMDQVHRTVVANQGVSSYSQAAAKLGKSPAALDLQLKHSVLLHKLAALRLPPDPKDMYHVRGILIRPGGKHARTDEGSRLYALSLQQKIANGADIAALAKAESEDNQSAPTGGDLGIIQTCGAPNLVKESLDFTLQQRLASAVTTAKTDSFLEGPIHGKLGYWVVQVQSTGRDQRDDQLSYSHITSLWRSQWMNRLEPLVMSNLRGTSAISPSVAPEKLKRAG